MSGYLLLRNNKQSGPYSFDELIEKGFKPYDLIWAEGKSAGWRYASELPELARYAPAVEEQPFDRFYKKTPARSEHPLLTEREREREREREKEREREREREREVVREAERTQVLNKNEDLEEIPRRSRVVAMKPRKISVTFPENAEVISPVPPAIAADEEITPSFSEPVTSLESKAEAIRKRALEASKPVLADYSSLLPDTRNEKLPANPLPQSVPASPNFQSTENRYNLPTQRTRLSNSMVAAVAACLVLGGIVIGLAISNSRQSAAQEQLSQYVQQKIKERKESIADNSATPPVHQQQEPTPTESEPTGKDPVVDKQEPAPNETTIARQVAAHKKEDEPVTKSPSPAATKIINAVQQDNPASIKTEKRETPIENKQKEPINTAAIETTRKKIYDLVSVEGSKYKVGVLGGISNLELTVSNNSLYPLDEVEVTVNYHGPEKRIVRKETVLISDIAAGEQKLVAVPRSKRGVSVTYAVSRINSRVLGLAHSGL